MPDPVIHIIPAAYYGGAAPKQARRPAEVGGLVPEGKKSAGRKVSPRLLFFAVVGILFLGVVGGSVWYFTRPLKAPAPAPAPTPAPTPSPASPVEPVPAPAPPEPKPLPTPEGVGTPTPPEADVGASPTSDADNDGLTLAEEEIYKTQPTLPDTDNDGFLDGHELFNLYNPSGIAPEKLEAAGLVARFRHASYPYEILYPTGWPVLPEAGAREVTFQSAAGESISVSVVDNPDNTTLDQWATGEGGTVTAWATNKAGLNGVLIKGEADLRGAFAGSGLIYVVRYAPAEGGGAYMRTFEMMLNGFRIMN